MAEKIQKRQTAFKSYIKDITEGEYIQQEGFNPNYIITKDKKKLSRVNIIGVVISKQEEENYVSFLIEDSTGQISARIFEKESFKEEVNAGDVVLLIARPREFGGNKYLLAEILRKINPEWIKIRNLELKKQEKETPKIIEENTESVVEEDILEEPTKDNDAESIIENIRKFDNGEGSDFQEVIKGIKNGERIIEMLMREGDVFEIKPGKLKVLE